MKHKIDISNELIIHRMNHGVTLSKPQSNIYLKNESVLSVDNFLQLPFSVWFCNTDCEIVAINDECANVCGMISTKAFVGKTAFDFMVKKQATIAINHDTKVMINNALKIMEFDLIRLDGPHYQSLSFKFPWYNEENKLIGTMGCGIILGRNNLSYSLSKLINFGLLSFTENQTTKNYLPTIEKTVPYFSRRELQCLRLTVRGKTAKQVALELKISSRTVEEYLNNIKLKLGALSKAELIDKALDYFQCISNL